MGKMSLTELDKAWAELTGPGQPFEVVRTKVLGSPTLAYKNAPASLREIWQASAVFAEQANTIFQDERYNYSQAHKISASVANWLFDRGVAPGDRVAIAMRNYPEWMFIYWGCVSVGITVVGLNAWWTAEELAYGLKDSMPKVVFCDEERLERILDRPEVAKRSLLVGVRSRTCPQSNDWSEVVSRGGNFPNLDIPTDADACILYTSGTTGTPKGAVLTHRGCVTNLKNLAFSQVVQTKASILAQTATAPQGPLTAPPAAAFLLATPLFHVTANNCGAQLAAMIGGSIILMHRWDAGEALRLIEKERVTSISGVPMMSRELMAHPDFEKHDTSTLAVLGGGGAQLQPDLVAEIDTRLASARPSSGYGMTETSGIIATITGDFFLARPDSVGRAVPTLEIKCVDDRGVEVAKDEAGELWVRGSPVIKGYLNQPDATAEAITDGWLHTGDIARVDEQGYIFIVDRKKEMVLRGGENIYCAEVQTALHRHPSVIDCAVFGIPDDRLGEEVGAAIVLRSDGDASAAEIRAHCANLIARHKVPRYIWLQTEPLTRNASGKIVKLNILERLNLQEGLQ
jgi:long-chain acyl-CoA synthetase